MPFGVLPIPPMWRCSSHSEMAQALRRGHAQPQGLFAHSCRGRVPCRALYTAPVFTCHLFGCKFAKEFEAEMSVTHGRICLIWVLSPSPLQPPHLTLPKQGFFCVLRVNECPGHICLWSPVKWQPHSSVSPVLSVELCGLISRDSLIIPAKIKKKSL